MGVARATYHVHLYHICNASPYFKRAFKGSRDQAANKYSIELVDDDADTVERFVSWLYSKTYTLPPFYTEEETHERFNQLAKLNVFADKYSIPALSSDTIDRLWDPWHLYLDNVLSSRKIFCPRISLVAYVYEHTSPDSEFRKTLVDWYTWEIPLKWYDDRRTRDELGEVSQDFAVDLVMALAKRLADPERPSPFALPKTDYNDDPRGDCEDDEAVDLTSCPED